MAEKDASARFRRAVKENNLFLVKRLLNRVDIRNPDPSPKRYTSLAWAAVLGHEETFEFLLSQGHDDEELSKDSENNTILMLLADTTLETAGYTSPDTSGALLRMARLYYDRYSQYGILDWSNIHGKTALHIAALKGNEELVRILCDLGADVDLSDNKGNTPLHYASMWGHIPSVQLLIERGCSYTARNNEGSTASDYAYSFTTREALQETARLQHENMKKQRRQIFAQAAQAAARNQDRANIGLTPPPVPAKDHLPPRVRSGSGTSRTTATSDSTGDPDYTSQSPSYSQPSSGSRTGYSNQLQHRTNVSGSSTSVFGTTKPLTLSPPPHQATALTPIANRVRERDAGEMEKYLMRNRSGSSSTENNGSTLSSTQGEDDLSDLVSGSVTPRRLRPSASANQLRNGARPEAISDSRHRAGTSPVATRGGLAPLVRAPSGSRSLRSMPSTDGLSVEPPHAVEGQSTPTSGHRKGFHHILSRHGFDSSASSSHRRGMSAASVRGS